METLEIAVNVLIMRTISITVLPYPTRHGVKGFCGKQTIRFRVNKVSVTCHALLHSPSKFRATLLISIVATRNVSYVGDLRTLWITFLSLPVSFRSIVVYLHESKIRYTNGISNGADPATCHRKDYFRRTRSTTFVTVCRDHPL